MSINPFDEYIASMKTPTKCMKRITIRRVVHVIKKKPALSKTEKKILMLEQQLEEMRSLLLLPLPIEGIRRIQYQGREIAEYNIYQSSISISEINSIFIPDQYGIMKFYKKFVCLSGYDDELIQQEFRMSEEEYLNLIDEIKHIKTIHISSNEDIYNFEQRNNIVSRTDVDISERMMQVLNLLIHNNKNCEIHFRLSVNHFMLKHICSKIKLSNVSKIIIHIVHDTQMYSTYMSRNPYIKMTQRKFTDSYIKILMDTIKEKYHHKFHIISPRHSY